MVASTLQFNNSSSDSYLIILGAGSQQKRAFEKAKTLGIKTIAVDINPSAVARTFANKFLLASVKNEEECINGLKKLNLKYSGVITYGVEVSLVVSEVAKEFGLIAVPKEVSYKTTNKCARSKALLQQQIPIPKYEIIGSFSKPKMELPFVVKPSDNSGSRGVRLVSSLSEWDDAYEEALSLSNDGKVVVEEYLIGQEISVEGFLIDGKMIVYGFTDRNFIRDGSYYPYFVEDGSSCPTLLSQDIVREAKEIFSNAANALSVNNGPSKGDLIVTKDGVQVLEITSRLSPAFSLFSPYVVGVDPLTETIKWSLGLPVNEDDLKPRFEKGMAHRYYFHKPGKIMEIKGFENIRKMPGVIDVVQLKNFSVGDILEPVSYINRLFYIITVGETRDEAEYLASEALSSVSIKTE